MDENPRCEACDGINCNCIIVWNTQLQEWFPIQQTELLLIARRKKEGT